MRVRPHETVARQRARNAHRGIVECNLYFQPVPLFLHTRVLFIAIFSAGSSMHSLSMLFFVLVSLHCCIRMRTHKCLDGNGRGYGQSSIECSNRVFSTSRARCAENCESLCFHYSIRRCHGSLSHSRWREAWNACTLSRGYLCGRRTKEKYIAVMGGASALPIEPSSLETKEIVMLMLRCDAFRSGMCGCARARMCVQQFNRQT